MSKIFFSSLLLVLGMGNPFYAQQTPTFTEYNYNPFIINPAYAGVQNAGEATLSNIGFGNQNIQGAPRSLAFTYNTPLNGEKVGLGAGVINDEIGVTSATQVFASYAYKVYLNNNTQPYWKVYERSFISFGLNGGVLMYNQDLLSLGLQDDPNFQENVNATMPTLGAGILFGHNNFFVGVSVPNLLGETLSNQDNLKLSRPVYGYVGHHFVLDRYNPDFMLKPSFLFKYEEGAPFQVDANLSLSIKSIVEVGVGFRTSSTLNTFLGCYLFNNFRALYSYSQGNADSPIGNTHGIVLSYRVRGYENRQ